MAIYVPLVSSTSPTMAEQALAIKALPQPNQRWTALFSANFVDLIVPVAILAIIIALITPMPALLLDFLLAIDIMLSIDGADGLRLHHSPLSSPFFPPRC